MKGVTHYTKDGKPFKGKTHKMKDGTLHTGASHTRLSKSLFHFKDLPASVQKKIKKKQWTENLKKLKKQKGCAGKICGRGQEPKSKTSRNTANQTTV